jgi:hypothetical protein
MDIPSAEKDENYVSVIQSCIQRFRFEKPSSPSNRKYIARTAFWWLDDSNNSKDSDAQMITAPDTHTEGIDDEIPSPTDEVCQVDMRDRERDQSRSSFQESNDNRLSSSAGNYAQEFDKCTDYSSGVLEQGLIMTLEKFDFDDTNLNPYALPHDFDIASSGDAWSNHLLHSGLKHSSKDTRDHEDDEETFDSYAESLLKKCENLLESFQTKEAVDDHNQKVPWVGSSSSVVDSVRELLPSTSSSSSSVHETKSLTYDDLGLNRMNLDDEDLLETERTLRTLHDNMLERLRLMRGIEAENEVSADPTIWQNISDETSFENSDILPRDSLPIMSDNDLFLNAIQRRHPPLERYEDSTVGIDFHPISSENESTGLVIESPTNSRPHHERKLQEVENLTVSTDLVPTPVRPDLTASMESDFYFLSPISSVDQSEYGFANTVKRKTHEETLLQDIKGEEKTEIPLLGEQKFDPCPNFMAMGEQTDRLSASIDAPINLDSVDHVTHESSIMAEYEHHQREAITTDLSGPISSTIPSANPDTTEPYPQSNDGNSTVANNTWGDQGKEISRVESPNNPKAPLKGFRLQVQDIKPYTSDPVVESLWARLLEVRRKWKQGRSVQGGLYVINE